MEKNIKKKKVELMKAFKYKVVEESHNTEHKNKKEKFEED
jgi:hypothetical protein